MFVGFFFDARLLQKSTVGAVMGGKTSCSRYAKWLRLLRRRIECKGVRVGRIHKLWTVYGFLECVGWWAATSEDAVGVGWVLRWCWRDAAGNLQSAAGADVAGTVVVGAATFAGRRADGGWQWKRFDGRPVCVWCGCGWDRVVDAAGGERKNLRGDQAGLREWLKRVRVSAKNHRILCLRSPAGWCCQQQQAEHKHKHNSLLLLFAVVSRSCLARLRI